MIFAFSAFLVFLACVIIVKGKLKKSPVDLSSKSVTKLGIKGVYLALVSLMLGVAAGFFGLGGGILLVPMLILIIGMPIRLASNISIMVMVMTSSVALAIHLWQGHVPLFYSLLSLVGIIPGAFIGSRVKERLPEKVMRRILVSAMLLIASIMFFGAS